MSPSPSADLFFLSLVIFIHDNELLQTMMILYAARKLSILVGEY